MKGLIDMSATTVIKEILELKGKSQAELAEEINITRQNLSNKMNRDKFSAMELVEIADALEMNLILKEKDETTIIGNFKKYMKDKGFSEQDIEMAETYGRVFNQFLSEKQQESIIDYPDELKGRSKRNMTDEEKKAAQKKSEATKARNAKKQVESQDN